MIPSQDAISEHLDRFGAKTEREMLEYFCEPKDNRREVESRLRTELIRMQRAGKVMVTGVSAHVRMWSVVRSKPNGDMGEEVVRECCGHRVAHDVGAVILESDIAGEPPVRSITPARARELAAALSRAADEAERREAPPSAI